MPGCPVVIRYADDLLALCHSREQAEQVKARLAEWLAPRGLVFNEDKTQITHLDQGVDFLGFTIRRYPRRQAADQTEQRRFAADPETAVHRGAGPARGQRRRGDRQAQPDHRRVGGLLPDRGVQSSVQRVGRPHVEADLQVGHALATRTSRSAGSIARYFGMFNPSRQRPVGVRDRDSRLLPAQVRLDADRPAPDGHRAASPGRPRPDRLLGQAATPQQTPAGHGHTAPAADAARPLPALRRPAAPRRPRAAKPTEWEQWLRATRKAIRKHAVTAPGSRHAGRTRRTRLMHAHCHRRHHPAPTQGTALLHPPASLRACLSRMPGKRARPVLRGPRRSNAPGLPDAAPRGAAVSDGGEMTFVVPPS